MDELVQTFSSHVRKNHLFSSGDNLIIAVSGGVDSVVLCELCKRAGYNFSIAHCNFQLRGEESERDERFVKALAEKYGVEIFVKKFDTEKYAAENKISIQEAARNLRYSWFSQLISGLHPQTPNSVSDQLATRHSPLTISNPLAFVLTAHHHDDNIETILMNFFRGTGLHGLTGIPVKNSYVRRPLLPFSKTELIEFAKEKDLSFVEDSSNESLKYTRNFFRNEIIPAIAKIYPQVSTNLQDNVRRFTEIEKLYKTAVAEIKKKLCKQKGAEIHIPAKQLEGYNSRALIYEIIAGYGFTEKQVDEIIKLMQSESGRYIVSQGKKYQILRHRHWLIIGTTQKATSENIIIEAADKEILFSLGKLQLSRTKNYKLQTANSKVILDSANIQFPLLLRRWKTADYFYPLGMKKKKKLSRFFIDQKLSKNDKEKVWVIESDKRIIWVVGYRIDERFKIDTNTKEAFEITLLPAE